MHSHKLISKSAGENDVVIVKVKASFSTNCLNKSCCWKIEFISATFYPLDLLLTSYLSYLQLLSDPVPDNRTGKREKHNTSNMLSPYTILSSLVEVNDQRLECTWNAIGPSHRPEFTANVLIERMPTLSAQGQGKTKKDAQHRAANEILHKIKDRLEELKWKNAEFLRDYDFDSFELSLKAKKSLVPIKNFISAIHEFCARERYNLSPVVYEETLNKDDPNPNNYIFQIKVVLPDIKDQNSLPVETMATSSKKQIAKNEAFEKMYNLLQSMGYNLEAKRSQMRHALTNDENNSPSSEQVTSLGPTSNNEWDGSFDQLKKLAEEKEMTLEIKESELEDSEGIPPSKNFCCLVTLIGGWSRAATGLGRSPVEAKNVAADNLLKLIPNDA